VEEDEVKFCYIMLSVVEWRSPDVFSYFPFILRSTAIHLSFLCDLNKEIKNEIFKFTCERGKTNM
jgi:hypothetical protein